MSVLLWIYLQLKTRPLPEKRSAAEIASYTGALKPQRIPVGHLSLETAVNITADVRQMPGTRQDIAKTIAKEYKLDLVHVEQFLTHFKSLDIHLPQSMVKEYPKLQMVVKSGSSINQRLENMRELKAQVQQKLSEKIADKTGKRFSEGDGPTSWAHDKSSSHWGDVRKEDQRGKDAKEGSTEQTTDSIPNEKQTDKN